MDGVKGQQDKQTTKLAKTIEASQAIDPVATISPPCGGHEAWCKAIGASATS